MVKYEQIIKRQQQERVRKKLGQEIRRLVDERTSAQQFDRIENDSLTRQMNGQ